MKNVIPESTIYDNYLDEKKRLEDNYSVSLEKFIEKTESKLIDETKSKKKNSSLYKILYVHFRNIDDLADFCKKIGQVIGYNMKETYYPLSDPNKSLFPDLDPVLEDIDYNLIRPKSSPKTTSELDVNIDAGETNKWKEHWTGMPEYVQENNPPYKTVHIKFRTKEHYENFGKRISQNLSEESKSIWYPKLEITANRLMRWIQDDRTLPKHPVYIVSKGRADTMYTSRSLSRMQIPHYIVVEPQDMQSYDNALDVFDIRQYVTLLEAPFSNHGDGPGRARNWAWDHSISIGADSHWVMDDNISDFYRLNRNQRIRFESGVGFKVMEDFVDRYDNILIAGPQYRFFIAPDSKYPPFVTNTRIYSTLLIRNDCKHRWRGRYNEDTDICLRVLKDGDCTVQFNAFLQGKSATQTVGGGNTAEFYHSEFVDETEETKLGKYNAKGTINKSQMLKDMHPDVTRVVFRYGRWHHWVDYTPFKRNKLKFKSGVSVPEGVDDYGMRLIKNYGLDEKSA